MDFYFYQLIKASVSFANGTNIGQPPLAFVLGGAEISLNAENYSSFLQQLFHWALDAGFNIILRKNRLTKRRYECERPLKSG